MFIMVKPLQRAPPKCYSNFNYKAQRIENKPLGFKHIKTTAQILNSEIS